MGAQTTESDLTAIRAIRGKLKRDLFRLSEWIGLGASGEEILQELSTLQEKARALLPDGQTGGAAISVQQQWRHKDSGRRLRITYIQMGALHRPGDAANPWVPEEIFWEDVEDPTRQGHAVVNTWRKFMTEVDANVDSTPEAGPATTKAGANTDALRQEIQA